MSAVRKFLATHLATLIVVFVLTAVGLIAFFASPNEDGTRTYDGKAPTYSEAQELAYCEAKSSNDAAIAGFTGINIPQDAGSGCEPTDIPQLGSIPYYDVDVSTPAAFYNAVNGKGFNEGYGLQCVAGFKEFQYALSGKYIATSNGGASGYANQQSQIEPLGFKWHSGTSGLQDGDWAIWGTGTYGHVAMYYKGKFFGQNQGASDPIKGNAFNLMGITQSGILGYYRPNIYVNTTGASDGGNDAGTGSGSDVSDSYTVQRGDTLGGISLTQGWWTTTKGLYGDSGYAQRLADKNGIQNRGVIFPNMTIQRAE